MKVLKIGAVWCNGCLVMRPRWAEIEKKYSWLNTEYHDFDQDKELVNKYGLDSGVLPVFIFLDSKGQEIHRESGEVTQSKLETLINQYRNL